MKNIADFLNLLYDFLIIQEHGHRVVTEEQHRMGLGNLPSEGNAAFVAWKVILFIKII